LIQNYSDREGKLNQQIDEIAISEDEQFVAAVFDFTCDIGIWPIKKEGQPVIHRGTKLCTSAIRFSGPRSILYAENAENAINIYEGSF